MKQVNKIRLLVLTALFAALTFLGTRINIPLGMNNRIVHLGDAVVYLSACILPLPYAMASSAIGAGLSDFTTPGCMIWVLPTILIKPLLVTFFTSKPYKIVTKRNTVAIFLAGIVGSVAYAIAEWIIYGNFIAALMSIPAGAFQPIGSGILFMALALAFDNMKLKNQLNLNQDFNKERKNKIRENVA
ncbi:TIGR04002 family protein [Cellulosilyticum ruminicola]|uniref:TIGR04002 family protein n=1 Tax=Cellulosilyticum ruminicola TaxID=425254 RepID=UPI0006D15CD0|nr:TIGR04002 family protein [Cellulosilyticum ruminicola]